MIIRHGKTPNEIKANLYIRALVFGEELKYPQEKIFDEQDREADLFVGYIGLNPICSARLIIKDDIAYISHIAVVPNFRQQGNGRALLKIIENNIISNYEKISRIQVEPTNNSILFLEKCGFSFNFNDTSLGMNMEKKINIS